VVLIIFYGAQLLQNSPETILAPVAVLSLFVLSVAVMGYLFVAVPALMYLEGKKQEAISFFLKTVFSFAAMILVWIVVILATARLI
jgi:hypothetical protein